MTEPVFDTGGLFDEDYLYFFADVLEERSGTPLTAGHRRMITVAGRS